MAIEEEYERVRGLDDHDIILEASKHKEFLVRELANRYDVLIEKYDAETGVKP